MPPPTSSSGTHAGPLMLVEATLDNWCGRRHHPIAKGQSIQPNVMSCRCLRVGSCCRFIHGSHSSRCLCAGRCCCFSHSPHSSSCLQHIGKFASVCQAYRNSAVVAPAAAVPWGHKPSHPPPLQGCTIQRGSPAQCRCGAQQIIAFVQIAYSPLHTLLLHREALSCTTLHVMAQACGRLLSAARHMPSSGHSGVGSCKQEDGNTWDSAQGWQCRQTAEQSSDSQSKAPE